MDKKCLECGELTALTYDEFELLVDSDEFELIEYDEEDEFDYCDCEDCEGCCEFEFEDEDEEETAHEELDEELGVTDARPIFVEKYVTGNKKQTELIYLNLKFLQELMEIHMIDI